MTKIEIEDDNLFHIITTRCQLLEQLVDKINVLTRGNEKELNVRSEALGVS